SVNIAQSFSASREYLDHDVGAAAQALVVGAKAVAAGRAGCGQVQGIRGLEVEVSPQLGGSVEDDRRERHELHVRLDKEAVDDRQRPSIFPLQGADATLQPRQVADG